MITERESSLKDAVTHLLRGAATRVHIVLPAPQEAKLLVKQLNFVQNQQAGRTSEKSGTPQPKCTYVHVQISLRVREFYIT